VDLGGRKNGWGDNEWKEGNIRERDHTTKIRVSLEIPSLKPNDQ